MKLGAQLYTVHEHTTTLEDFDRTLSRIAAIGYRFVQVSGTCAYEPKWLRDTLKKYGLTCVLTHIDPHKLEQAPAQVAAEHRDFGCAYIGIGGMPMEYRGMSNGAESFYKRFLPVAKKLKENGAKLFYHNHAFEMQHINGRPVLCEIADLFAPEELSLTLDTYWLQAGGANPIDWIKKLPGRLECVHLKDMAADEKNQACMRPIFEGNMDFCGIIDACYEMGTEYVLVEQDDCYGEDPFDCLERSFQNIIKRYPDLR